MEDRPEAIIPIREIMAGGGGCGCRVNPAEDHVEATGENVRFIFSQSDLPRHVRTRPLSWSDDRITPNDSADHDSDGSPLTVALRPTPGSVSAAHH